MIWKWHDDLQGEQSPRFVLCKDTPIDRVPSASLRRLSALLIASCKIPPPVRLCAFLRFNLTESEIWTFPKEHDPNPSINGASSSGRINRTTLDHLGRPRTKIHGGIILYTRQEVARNDPLLPHTAPHRFRSLHCHPLSDFINLSPHHLPMVHKIELLGP